MLRFLTSLLSDFFSTPTIFYLCLVSCIFNTLTRISNLDSISTTSKQSNNIKSTFFVSGSIVSTSPFDGTTLYVPEYIKSEIDESISLHPSQEYYYNRIKTISQAYWFDGFTRIINATTEFDNALSLQQDSDDSTQYAIVVVIYNLPNRDCAAAASNGKIDCEDSSCTDGINTYKTLFIDPLYDLFSTYNDLRFIAIIEPDSLPNLATNLDIDKCSEAKNAYIEGVAYAIEKFGNLDNIGLYIDAAHGGWLGWDSNQVTFANIIKNVTDICTNSLLSTSNTNTVRIDGNEAELDSSFDCSDLVRGFSSNVAGYQPTGCLNSCSNSDPCELESQYNDCINEVIYSNQLASTFESYTNFDTVNGWIIDTSRNGVIDARSDCSNWCNIEGSGLGYPTMYGTNVTEITESDLIDAFVWVKIPGESDGTSDTTSDRYDSKCSSVDSLTDAPEAGTWFDDFFVQLVDNADPEIKELILYSSTTDDDDSGNNEKNSNGSEDSTAIVLGVVLSIVGLIICVALIFGIKYYMNTRSKRNVNVNDPAWSQSAFVPRAEIAAKEITSPRANTTTNVAAPEGPTNAVAGV